MKLTNCFTDDNQLRRVFTWLTRIGAAPKFGSRPIGWYQQHQCAAIEYLEEIRGCHGFPLRCKRGMIQCKPTIGSWYNVATPSQVFEAADNFCRTGKF